MFAEVSWYSVFDSCVRYKSAGSAHRSHIHEAHQCLRSLVPHVIWYLTKISCVCVSVCVCVCACMHVFWCYNYII